MIPLGKLLETKRIDDDATTTVFSKDTWLHTRPHVRNQT